MAKDPTRDPYRSTQISTQSPPNQFIPAKKKAEPVKQKVEAKKAEKLTTVGKPSRAPEPVKPHVVTGTPKTFPPIQPDKPVDDPHNPVDETPEDLEPVDDVPPAPVADTPEVDETEVAPPLPKDLKDLTREIALDMSGVDIDKIAKKHGIAIPKDARVAQKRQILADHYFPQGE